MNIPRFRIECLLFLKIYWIGGVLQVNLACRLQVEDLTNGHRRKVLHWSHVTPVTDLRCKVAFDFQKIFGVRNSLSVKSDVTYEGFGRPNLDLLCDSDELAIFWTKGCFINNAVKCKYGHLVVDPIEGYTRLR